ncbi:MAG TPA: hypothetical protein VEW03_01785 [Longimicrobiaceae bacterium]|nr:hypothetical protein [Longimicrobiaceae bacterium]
MRTLRRTIPLAAALSAVALLGASGRPVAWDQPGLARCHGPPVGGEATAVIGSEGGSLHLRPAGHSLDVPPGAVQAPTAFRLAEVVQEGYVVVDAEGGGYFNPRVVLSLNVRRCGGPASRVARLHPDGTIQVLEGVVRGAGPARIVSVELEHLSRYAVAE